MAAPDAALQAELEALPQEALETRCRRSGLSRRGSAADMVRVRTLARIAAALPCCPGGSKRGSCVLPAWRRRHLMTRRVMLAREFEFAQVRALPVQCAHIDP